MASAFDGVDSLTPPPQKKSAFEGRDSLVPPGSKGSLSIAQKSAAKSGILDQAQKDFMSAASPEFQSGMRHIKEGLAKDATPLGSLKVPLGGMEIASSPFEGAANAVAGGPLERATHIPASVTNFVVQAIGPAAAEKLLPALAEYGPAVVLKVATKLGWVDESATAAKAPEALASTEAPKASTQVKAASKASYKAAEKLGGTMTPKFTNDLVTDLYTLAQRDPIAELALGKHPLTTTLEGFSKIKDKPLSLAAIKDIDETLGKQAYSKVHPHGGLTDEGYDLLNVQDKLRAAVDNALENPTLSHVSGGKGGFEAVKKARDLWSAERKMSDLEAIVSKANMMEQPANAIKSGVRTLLHNPKRVRGYSEEDIADLKKIAHTGMAEDAMRAISSRLIPYATAASGGGPVKDAAAFLVSHAARKLNGAVETGKVNKVIENIGSKVLGKEVSAANTVKKGLKPVTKTAQKIGATSDLAKVLSQIPPSDQNH